MDASDLTTGRVARALAVPVGGGVVWMLLAGAPSSYVLVNSASLTLALALALLIPFPKSADPFRFIPWLCLGGLWICAISGADIDGMRRWFSLGGVRLHAGYLLLPVLIVLITQQSDVRRNLMLALAALATAVMPDYGAGAGLLLVAIRLAWQAGPSDKVSLTVAGLVAVCFGVAVWRDQPLPAVAFVEKFGVPQGLFGLAGYYVLPVFVLLIFLSLWPVRLGASSDPRAKGLALWWLGTIAAAPFGPFPWLLIGYGAAPILGLGLALAALRRQ